MSNVEKVPVEKLPVNDRVKAAINNEFSARKEFIEKGQETPPTACIIHGRSIDILVANLPPFDGMRKDMFADAVRMAAKQLDADAVMIVSEAWTLEGDLGSKEDVNRVIREGIANNPKRVEVLSMSLDTGMFQSLGMAKIVRDGGNVTLQPIEFYLPANGADVTQEGRFTNLVS